MGKNTNYIIISELDYLIIEKVRTLRIKKNLSKQELSKKMGVAVGFVGKVETLSLRDKYNIRHLGLIANIFELKSVRDLLPEKLPKYDLVKIVYTKTPKTNKDGSESKQMEEKVIRIEPV